MRLAKPLAIELAWLLCSWAFSFAATGYVTGYATLWQGPVEVQMHNTYFVMNTTLATFPLFMVFASLFTGLRLLAARRPHRGTRLVLGCLGVLWLLIVVAVAAAWK